MICLRQTGRSNDRPRNGRPESYNKVWLELTIFCTVQLHEQDSHPPISISTLSLFVLICLIRVMPSLKETKKPQETLPYTAADDRVHYKLS
jgi:hypothetical protein